jgi:hypothetical protein
MAGLYTSSLGKASPNPFTALRLRVHLEPFILADSLCLAASSIRSDGTAAVTGRKPVQDASAATVTEWIAGN